MYFVILDGWSDRFRTSHDVTDHAGERQNPFSFIECPEGPPLRLSKFLCTFHGEPKLHFIQSVVTVNLIPTTTFRNLLILKFACEANYNSYNYTIIIIIVLY